MKETEEEDKKPMHFGRLLLLSFALFNLGSIIDQTIRWSNHFHGFLNGLINIITYGIAWCIFVIPWSLIIFGLYRWFKWKRFRTYWVLVPSLVILTISLSLLITDPPTAAHRFKSFADTELPEEIQNFHYHFSGGGLADYRDTYYFETTPNEVDRLIAEMDLEEDDHYGEDDFFYTPVKPLPECPDFTAWIESKHYLRQGGESGWFYYLLTDASKTKVYILIGCI